MSAGSCFQRLLIQEIPDQDAFKFLKMNFIIPVVGGLMIIFVILVLIWAFLMLRSSVAEYQY